MLYAPSDFISTNVPAENGGCGAPHFRPAAGGEPVLTWGLECALCEDFLRRTDSRWSPTLLDVPLTYDQQKAKDAAEKSGKMDRERQLAESLIALAPLGQLPEALARLLSPLLAASPAAIQGQVVCPSGHAQATGQKFCGDCGAAMHGTVAAAGLPSAQKDAPAGNGRPRRLRDARADELQALARQHGLEHTGTRPDLIARLSGAGVTSNDLARLTPVAA
ncbi:MAG TPA: hypothetical protein VMV92_12635 [Streptosporangiaceae bacterium]|nr:hypothetical protein [Streptosporangiaceae bacterium]